MVPGGSVHDAPCDVRADPGNPGGGGPPPGGPDSGRPPPGGPGTCDRPAAACATAAGRPRPASGARPGASRGGRSVRRRATSRICFRCCWSRTLMFSPFFSLRQYTNPRRLNTVVIAPPFFRASRHCPYNCCWEGTSVSLMNRAAISRRAGSTQLTRLNRQLTRQQRPPAGPPGRRRGGDPAS